MIVFEFASQAVVQLATFLMVSTIVWLIFILPVTIAKLRNKVAVKHFWQFSILLVGVSILGSAAGTAGGLSRESVVGDIIPAIFAFLGGISLYIFGKEPDRGVISSILASALAVSLIFSYSITAQIRNDSEERRDIREKCAEVFLSESVLLDAFNPQSAGASNPLAYYCLTKLKWNITD